MDLGRIPVLAFQLWLFFGVAVFLGGIHFYFPAWMEGALVSVFLQMAFFQLKFGLFRLLKHESMTPQLLILMLSFFTNGLFLLFFAVEKGSNFILGFFVAYFAFLGIFVLSAILSKRVATGKS